MLKAKLGQFYTTNYAYILQNMSINHDYEIIEPFAGNKDLVKFIDKVECYDIDPKHEDIIQRDTLLNPPSYKNKFVITNPPYLAKNKINKVNEINKVIYDKYECDDLYKCFIKSIIIDTCAAGIIIVPINFISSIRKKDIELRKQFLEKYNIELINIFEERVFDDTSCAVCSIQFNKREETTSSHNIKTVIYPQNKTIEIKLDKEHNYTIGGEIYKLPQSKYKVSRATRLSKEYITNILLDCIDTNNKKISLKYIEEKDRYIDNTKNLSSRSYAILTIEPAISEDTQLDLIEKFNAFISENRKKYNSLFLTNYREGNRKRISFKLAFRICSYLLRNI